MNNENKLVPRLICKSADAAIQFYTDVFGATETVRYTAPNGVVVHSELSISETKISVVDAAPDWQLLDPRSLDGSPVLLHLTCDDPDATAELAVSNGAEIVVPIDTRGYGIREGRIRDPAGHLWIVSRVEKEMSPEEIQKAVDNFGT